MKRIAVLYTLVVFVTLGLVSACSHERIEKETKQTVAPAPTVVTPAPTVVAPPSDRAATAHLGARAVVPAGPGHGMAPGALGITPTS